MAHDFENIDDIDDLSDRELRQLVRARLADHRALDAREITVRVQDHQVELTGRVGTEAERRIAEHVVTDIVGVPVRNDLFVDELRRAQNAEAADDAAAEEDSESGLLLGDRPVPLSPEAEHIEEDLDGRMFGTSDASAAIREGTAWIPPTTPTPEGFGEDADASSDLEDDRNMG